MTPVLAVVGPTASGKTSLGIELAKRLDTEIVSADSMQFYRCMEIGTAAPTPDELARVKHHFIGFLDPGQVFSAGQYQEETRRVITELNAQGKTAVVVGGAGLYVRALIDGLFPGPGRDAAIRACLQQDATEHWTDSLYARLCEVDPGYAEVINPGDLRRIVRALEVYELTGRPMSVLHHEHREHAHSLEAVQVALDLPRDVLYARIEQRADRMILDGFVDEVQALIDNGYEEHIGRLRSLGYREVAAYLRGECSFDEALDLMKQNSRRYAKRQLSWFRADPRIRWLPVTPDTTARQLADAALALAG